MWPQVALTHHIKLSKLIEPYVATPVKPGERTYSDQSSVRFRVKPGNSGSAEILAGLSRTINSSFGRYTYTCRLPGSINQPRDAPVSMYSTILLRNSLRRSLGDLSSTTKSGHQGPKR